MSIKFGQVYKDSEGTYTVTEIGENGIKYNFVGKNEAGSGTYVTAEGFLDGKTLIKDVEALESNLELIEPDEAELIQRLVDAGFYDWGIDDNGTRRLDCGACAIFNEGTQWKVYIESQGCFLPCRNLTLTVDLALTIQKCVGGGE